MPAAAGMSAREHLPKLRLDVFSSDCTRLDCAQEIAGFGQGSFPAIDEERSRGDRRRIELPGNRLAGPHGVHMTTPLEPLAPYDRVGG